MHTEEETINYDEAKFTELLLYIAHRTKDDAFFGAIKVNKALFYSDFLHFASSGRPITGAEYQCIQHGPAPRRLLPVRKNLINEGALRIEQNAWRVKHLVPEGRGPDTSLFTEEELSFVDEVIDVVAERTAGAISGLTHLELGWQLAAEGEPIPYFTILLNFADPTASDLARAQELAHRFELVS